MHVYTHIDFDLSGPIAVVTVDRPDKMNALNTATLQELARCIDEIKKDPAVKGAIITGKGDKAFVAGADIKELASLSKEEAESLARFGHSRVFDNIAFSEKPFVAAINGFALGGGLELALACHVRFATPQAKMGLPELSLGLIPGYGGTQRLASLIGKSRAIEMILTGRMIDVETATSYGLIHNAFERSDLMARTKEWMQPIAQGSAPAMAAALRAIHHVDAHDRKGFEIEIDEFSKLFETDNFYEGTQAFLEKRKPSF